MNIILEFLIMAIVVVRSLLSSIIRFIVPPPRKRVKGDVALVTGSGRGIGRGLALEFARLGARVVLWDIDEDSNLETARQIREAGGQCWNYTCDVSDRETVYRTGRRVQQEVGEVSLLVNNAGLVCGRSLLDIPDSAVEGVFSVNLLAYFWTVKQFLPSMLRMRHGHVVNMASSTGIVGLSKLTAYSASKFGVVGFTEVLQYELMFGGHTDVHATLVCPSFVQTGMFDGCRMRFPCVLSPLETDATVTRIMEAILTNQPVVCIPRLIYIFSVIKAILPVEAFTEIIRFFGCGTFMDTYRGRLRTADVTADVESVRTTNRDDVTTNVTVDTTGIISDVSDDGIDVTSDVTSDVTGDVRTNGVCCSPP